MQIQQAIEIVQAKFVAESQDQGEGQAIEQYHDAFENYPCVMEVATHVFADQLIQRNYEAQKTQAQGQGGDQAPPPQGGPASGDNSTLRQ